MHATQNVDESKNMKIDTTTDTEKKTFKSYENMANNKCKDYVKRIKCNGMKVLTKILF